MWLISISCAWRCLANYNLFFFCHPPLLFHNYASAFSESVGSNEMRFDSFGAVCSSTQMSPVWPLWHLNPLTWKHLMWSQTFDRICPYPLLWRSDRAESNLLGSLIRKKLTVRWKQSHLWCAVWVACSPGSSSKGPSLLGRHTLGIDALPNQVCQCQVMEPSKRQAWDKCVQYNENREEKKEGKTEDSGFFVFH